MFWAFTSLSDVNVDNGGSLEIVRNLHFSLGCKDMIWYIIRYDMNRSLPTKVRVKVRGFNWAPCCEEMGKCWLIDPGILNVSSTWTWVITQSSCFSTITPSTPNVNLDMIIKKIIPKSFLDFCSYVDEISLLSRVVTLNQPWRWGCYTVLIH
jgi:hypothetical protein